MADRPRFETRRADWLGVEEAQRRILDGVEALPPLPVPLADALGHTTAADVTARALLPPWDNSAMDGYAVRAADVQGAREDAPVVLEVVGRILAGSDHRPTLAPGQACRVMTGAPLPHGADGVIRVEHTDAEAGEPGRVRIGSDHDAGGNVRPAGQDMRPGQVVVPAGTRIHTGWIALLAAAGADPVPVGRPPRVALLTGGDELRPTTAFDDVAAGRAIPDTNAPMLAAAVREAGGVPHSLGPARDDPEDIRRRLAAAAGADVVVTVGGASMGEADLLKRVLEEDGLEVDFWRARIRPGSPVAFGRLPRPGGGDPLPLLSLPGNPASAWVTFLLFVRPLLRRLLGDARPHLPVIRARAGERLSSVPHLCHFHRVVLDEAGEETLPVARLTGHQGSGLVHSLGPARGLAVVPEGVEALEAGEPVEVILANPDVGAATPGFSPLRP